MSGKRTKVYDIEKYAYDLPIFQGFSEEELKTFLKYVRIVEAKKGDYIFREGDEGDSVYLIVKGAISVLKSGKKGGQEREEEIAVLKKGELMGYLALIDGKKRSASCRAKRDVVLYRIDREDFNAMFMGGMKASFKVIDYLARDLAKKLRDADEKIIEFYRSADETIGRLLKLEGLIQ